MKNRATRASSMMFSYQWETSSMARVLPENSVVIPLTKSWWAWWDMLRSNGDFLSFMVSAYRNATKTPISGMTAMPSDDAMSPMAKLPVCR